MKTKQTADDPHLSEEEKNGLRFLAAVARQLPERRILVAGGGGRPVLLYSDASVEPGQCPILGWVLFVDDDQPQGRTLLMPAEAFLALKSRTQQIFPAEVFAAYAAVEEHIASLAGRDVIMFIDNESATAALVRGASKEDDVMSIIQAIHWTLLKHGARA